MLKFYFHIREGGSLLLDEEGLICRNWTEAKKEAYRSACDVMRQAGNPCAPYSIEIADQFGAVVDCLSVAPANRLPC